MSGYRINSTAVCPGSAPRFVMQVRRKPRMNASPRIVHAGAGLCRFASRVHHSKAAAALGPGVAGFMTGGGVDATAGAGVTVAVDAQPAKASTIAVQIIALIVPLPLSRQSAIPAFPCGVRA